MSLWSKGIQRSKTGEIRQEDDLTNPIDEFFSTQEDVVSYEISDNKNWVVDITGNLHLYESDLTDGGLFFKIGKLDGNLYCHFNHISPALIPVTLEGEIVVVPDEEEFWKNRHSMGTDMDVDDTGGMECLTAIPTRKEAIKKLEDILTDCIAAGYDIDFEEIINRLKNEWQNKDTYQLDLNVKGITKYGNIDCEILLGGNPINLTAIEKAYYLNFILHKEGVPLTAMKRLFVDEVRKIYSKLNDKRQDDAIGIMSGEMPLSATIQGYRHHIRKEIQGIVSHGRIVDDFAVEGKRGGMVYVKGATDELRNKIRQTFGM